MEHNNTFFELDLSLNYDVDMTHSKSLYFHQIKKDLTSILKDKKGLKMEFCPKCGSLLVPKKVKTEKEIKISLVCRKGDFVKEEKVITLKTPILKTKENSKKIVAVISKKDQKLSTLPTIKVECPKCENKKAYVWQVQTRGVDESSTQFMRCTKCDYTFRENT